jgi:hypothetical protein
MCKKSLWQIFGFPETSENYEVIVGGKAGWEMDYITGLLELCYGT